jgi:hypothetical protein
MNRRDPFGEGDASAGARRRRSLAIALALVAFVVIVFATTMIRMGQNTAGVREATAAGASAPAPPRSGDDG